MKKVKERKKLLSIIIITIFIAIGVGVFFAVRNQIGKVYGQTQVVNLKTTYLTLKYPKEYAKYLTYEELQNGTDTEIVFSMTYEEIEAELFRLSITAEMPDEYVGYLTLDNHSMYVSMDAAGLNPNIFAELQTDEALQKREEMEALYYSMLDGMSTVVQSLYSDKKFSTAKGISESEKQDKSMAYWKLSLPVAMVVDEMEENGVYCATFFGDIGGKTVKLYTISLGDAEAEACIGWYVVNGENRVLSVKTYDLATQEELSDEQRETAYAMMDTINDVLQTIRQDENFHDQLEPVA